MKYLLCFVSLFLPLISGAAVIGGPISGGNQGISSNTVYNMIITFGGGGATNGIQKLDGQGTNTTFFSSGGGSTDSSFGTTKFKFTQAGDQFHMFDADSLQDIFTYLSGTEMFQIGENFTVGEDLLVNDQAVINGIIYGNASGISNAVDLIPGSNITITTNANGRTFTIASTGGSGGGSPFTNIVVKSADNNPSPDQGAALVIRPQEVSTSPGVSAVWIEYLPTYTNDTYKGKFRHTITAVTNTLGDLLPDINWNISYNGGGNSSGVSPYGLTDTNEPVWIEQKESRWQNAGGLSQMEWWDYMATPYTANGTNFGARWWTGTLIWGTTNKDYVRLEAKATASTLEIQNPTATNGLAGVLFSANQAQAQSYTMTIVGSIIQHTNESGIGEIKTEGGLIAVGVPDGVTASSMIFRMDHANQLGSIDDQAYIYSAGNVKSLQIGTHTAANSFSNVTVNTNMIITGGITVTNGIRSRANLPFVLFPTNYPTAVGDVQTVTGTNAAGYVTTAWAPQSGSGGGDTNGLSYTDYPAISVTGNHRINLLYTNGLLALVVTNSGANSGVSLYNELGGEMARFNVNGFIDMEGYELRTEGDVAIQIGPTGMALLENTTETPMLSIANVGAPIAEMQSWWNLTGHLDTTNGTMTISPLEGTVVGDDAPAGTYGERQAASISSGSAVSLTTATAANVVSLPLTAGDWDVFGVPEFNPDTTTTTTYFQAGISTTTATLPAGVGTLWSMPFATADNAINVSAQTPIVRINVTSTTTVYLVAQAGFATSTMTVHGGIVARRVR